MKADNLPDCSKVWTTLVTNTKYMEGVLTLNFSLQLAKSKYPLVVLYTETLSKEGHAELDARGIFKHRIEYLLPNEHKEYENDTRFYDCWSKLQPFALTQFERVGQLDSDMVVVRNMDELMDLPLDVDSAPFAASHACCCNPYNKEHYPADWIPENCAYTHYGTPPKDYMGPPPSTGLSMCNGGLQIVLPSKRNYAKIVDALSDPKHTSSYEFADQSLLSDVFNGKWIPLSYKYNALKTLRLIHSDVWDDSTVKNIHYICNPKPWDTPGEEDDTGTFSLWHQINDKRLESERLRMKTATIIEPPTVVCGPKIDPSVSVTAS